MSNLNNTPLQQAAWKASQNLGSRFWKVLPSPVGRKTWITAQGRLSIRVLRSLAGKLPTRKQRKAMR